MKYKMRFPVFIIIVSILLGTLPSGSVQAGNNLLPGDDKLEQIKDYPCVSGVLHEGGVPYYTCQGWTGAESWITVPITTWETSPDYPIVGVPFLISLGSVPTIRPGTGSVYSFSKNNVTFPGLIDIHGLKTEIRLIPIKGESTFFSWNFNGVLDYDYDTMAFSVNEYRNYLGDKTEYPKIFGEPNPQSASNFGIPYYPVMGNVDDTMIIRAYATMSSYHAGNPSSYRGEPAYRMEIASHRQVQAQASWDSYRVWEQQFSHYKQVCRPGPSNAGVFECNASTSGYIAGHYEEVSVYVYKWSAPRSGGNGEWVNVMPINTSAVLWPDRTLYDHVPILVYQSQPILQEP